MSFTITDFSDLKRLLLDHPEWRAELRELVLTDELVALPRAFAETRASYEARFERIEYALEQLTQRVDQLTQRVDQLAQAQARTELRVDQLAQAQARTEQILQKLVERMDKFDIKLSSMVGTVLEIKYRNNARGYFGQFLQKIRVLPLNALEAAIEDALTTHLSEQEQDDLFQLDILLGGRLKKSAARADTPDVFLAVEVSAVIDRNDVERAQRRAQLLRKAELRAVPIVAGESVTAGATALLQDAPVVLMLDGRSDGWERALDHALKS